MLSDKNPITDYAHEGPGFPTWHRQFLLWVEREIQIEINDYTFRLPYWDWSDKSQRKILFTRERLGENTKKGKTVTEVDGDLFKNWKTYCWEDMSGLSFPPVNICNPIISSNQNLRRCPNETLCKNDNDKWPSKADVSDAVSIQTYDNAPYDRYVENASFRNYMEGFIVKHEGCVDKEDTLCTPKDTNITDTTKFPPVTRKLHNTVSGCLYGIKNCIPCTFHRYTSF